MIERRAEPHDDETGTVGTDQVSGLDDPEKRHLGVGEIPGEQERKEKFARHPKQCREYHERAETDTAHEQRKERHLYSLQRGVKHKDHDANSEGETAEDA